MGRLLAARSGHGDFADYNEIFNHEDALLTCSCGALKAPEHFTFCTRARARSRLHTPSRQDRAGWLLGTVKGDKSFHQ